MSTRTHNATGSAVSVLSCWLKARRCKKINLTLQILNVSKFKINRFALYYRRRSWWGEITELGEENTGANDILAEEVQKGNADVHARDILGESQTHQFSKDDPKCAETHVKDTESSIKTAGGLQAFSRLVRNCDTRSECQCWGDDRRNPWRKHGRDSWSE